MALTVAQLQIDRGALIRARSTGALNFRDQNGEAVQYKSDRQMAAALGSANA